MSPLLGLILIGSLMVVIAATGIIFAIRGCPIPATEKMKEDSMSVELAAPEGAATQSFHRTRSRM